LAGSPLPAPPEPFEPTLDSATHSRGLTVAMLTALLIALGLRRRLRRPASDALGPAARWS
jgi:hypothetical protein